MPASSIPICDPTPRGATAAIGRPRMLNGLARERGGPTRDLMSKTLKKSMPGQCGSTSAGGGGGEGEREVKLRERLPTQVLSRPADQGHSVEPIRAGQPAGRGGCGETGRGSGERYSSGSVRRHDMADIKADGPYSRGAGFRSDVAHNRNAYLNRNTCHCAMPKSVKGK